MTMKLWETKAVFSYDSAQPSEFPVKTCKSKKKKGKRKKRITIIDDDNKLRTLKLIDEKIEKYLN